MNDVEDMEIETAVEETENKSSGVAKYITLAVLFWQFRYFVSDAAIGGLFSIFRLFINLLKKMLQPMLCCGPLQELLDSFPTSVFTARTLIGLNRDSFEKYVVCPDCHALYNLSECVKINKRGNKVSSKCSCVLYPNHPHKSRRTPCNATLMKKVVSGDGKKTSLYPKKIYSYRPLKVSFIEKLQKPGFKELLFAKPLSFDDGILRDIQDGYVFKNFKDKDGENYFVDKRDIGVMMNLDWFNPFENSEYSLGAMYFAFLNLPRKDRFKWENILLLGIIPGPKEPTLTINTYLEPLVKDLNTFWEGVYLECENGGFYRIALLCISSDIPATRKCCGFVGFAANKGICNSLDYLGKACCHWSMFNIKERVKSISYNDAQTQKSKFC